MPSWRDDQQRLAGFACGLGFVAATGLGVTGLARVGLTLPVTRRRQL
jgi:hypothetical protein